MEHRGMFRRWLSGGFWPARPLSLFAPTGSPANGVYYSIVMEVFFRRKEFGVLYRSDAMQPSVGSWHFTFCAR